MALLHKPDIVDNRPSELYKVADLIDKEARMWDVIKINSSFEPSTTREILKFPFLPADQQDR